MRLWLFVNTNIGKNCLMDYGTPEFHVVVVVVVVVAVYGAGWIE